MSRFWDVKGLVPATHGIKFAVLGPTLWPAVVLDRGSECLCFALPPFWVTVGTSRGGVGAQSHAKEDANEAEPGEPLNFRRPAQDVVYQASASLATIDFNGLPPQPGPAENSGSLSQKCTSKTHEIIEGRAGSVSSALSWQ